MKESRAAKKPAASAKKKGEPNPPPNPDTELPADGGVRIALPGFEGPLDLLLHLIQEHELDILNIPIAFVTKKYLEYMDLMQSLNIDIASEYLVMAATLAHIKSRMLLPTPPADLEEGDEEELDPRAELIKRLLEYQKYKQASEELAARSVLGRDIFVRPPQPALDPNTAPLAPVGSFKLLEAFQRILSRTKIVVDHQVEFERFSLSDRINQLVDLLKGKGKVDFESLFEGQKTRADLIVTFLAMLELTRLRMTRIYQEGSLEPIYIEMVGDSDELNEHGERRLEGEEVPVKPPPPVEEPTRLPPLPELDERDVVSDEEEEFDVAKILAEAAAEEAEEKRLAAERRLAKKLAEAETQAEAETDGLYVAETSSDEGSAPEPQTNEGVSKDGDEMEPIYEATLDEPSDFVGIATEGAASISDESSIDDSESDSIGGELPIINGGAETETSFLTETNEDSPFIVATPSVELVEPSSVTVPDVGVTLSGAEAIVDELVGVVEEAILTGPESADHSNWNEFEVEDSVPTASIVSDVATVTNLNVVNAFDEAVTLSAADVIADEVEEPVSAEPLITYDDVGEPSRDEVTMDDATLDEPWSPSAMSLSGAEIIVDEVGSDTVELLDETNDDEVTTKQPKMIEESEVLVFEASIEGLSPEQLLEPESSSEMSRGGASDEGMALSGAEVIEEESRLEDGSDSSDNENDEELANVEPEPV